MTHRSRTLTPRPRSRRLAAVGCVLAILLSLLAAIPAVAQSEGFDIQLAPENTDAEAARGSGTVLTVSGTVPAGSLQDTRIIGIDGNGTEVPQVVSSRDPASENFVTTNGTELSGRVTLNLCFGRDPNNLCPTPNTGVERIFMQVTIDGVSARGPEQGLPNDFVRPEILRFDIVTPTRIVVVFSEAVRYRPSALLNQDRADDWTVAGGDIAVQRVESACAPPEDGNTTNQLCDGRVLVTETIPEDSTPTVRYVPGGIVGEQSSYVDVALNVINAADTPVTKNGTRAFDNVIPSIPTISQVAGRSPSGNRVTANTRTPVLALGNLNPNAVGQTLTLEVNGQVVRSGIAITGETQQVTAPDLGADRNGIALKVVAIDAAGNRSDSPNGSPQRPHGSNNPVSYDLDTVAPTIRTATRIAPTQVSVSFSEIVNPAGDAGRWTIITPDGTELEATASGSGLARTLVVPGGNVVMPQNQEIPEGSTVRWVGPGYADAASNGLVPRTLELAPPPPPVVIAPPVVRMPANNPTYSDSGTNTISGTVPAPATTVQLLRDGEVVDTSPVNQSSWTFAVTGTNGDRLDGYTVRARNGENEGSAKVTVPTIVIDTEDPAVTVTSPAPIAGRLPGQEDRRVFAQSAQVNIAWTVEEANFDRVTVTAIYDDGDDGARTPNRSSKVVGSGLAQSASINDTLPADFIGSVTYRVTATDLAARAGQGISHGILVADDVIGLTNPVLVANPLLAGGTGSRVTVDFTEAVTGTPTTARWSADDGLGGPSRTPLSVLLSGDRTITLDFARPFPGPNADPNATPTITFDADVNGGLDPLRDADGNRQIVTSSITAPDTRAPILDLTTGDQGPVNLADERVQITGSTDTTARPNNLVVRSSAQSGPVVDILEEGTFSVSVPVQRDAVTTLKVDVIDPAGLRAGEQLIRIIEDSTAPRLVSAVLRSSTEVEVRLDEVVTPNGNAGTWTVVRPDGTEVAATASGQGATRTLTRSGGGVFFEGPVQSGTARVRWTRGQSTYVDAAGNELVERVLALAPPTALPVPVISVPRVSPTFSRGNQSLEGTASPGTTQVQILRAGTVVQTIDVVDGRWSTTITGEDGERLDDYEVRAVNDIGGRSALAAVPTIVIDTTAPAVDVLSPTARQTTLPTDDDRRAFGQNSDVIVSWTTDEPNFDRLEVFAVYDDGDDGATTPNRPPERIATFRSRDGELAHTTPEDFVGQITYEVVATDLAGNRTDPPARSAEILVFDDIIGLTNGVLVPQTGLGGEILVDFSEPVAGTTNGQEWRASNGLPNTARDRAPVTARVQDERNATLQFAQPFPGNDDGAVVPADPNAQPSVEYRGGDVITGLSDADGTDPISGQTIAEDITPPTLSVSTPGGGPVNLADNTVTVVGTTDVSARDTTLTVSAATSDGPSFAQSADGPSSPTVVANESVNGTFSVSVGIAADRETTFTVEVFDPAGNTTTPATFSIIEDSAPPIITSMSAGLVGDDLVVVPLRFNEVVTQVRLEYDQGDDDFTPIETTSVGADRIIYNWDDLPAGLNLLQTRVRATATDVAGNESEPVMVPLGNLPRIATATFVDETHIEVTTDEPVTTHLNDAAGFAVRRGPGVQATSAEGTQITLTLASPIEPNADRVTYNGQGEWATEDGRPLRPGSVPLVIPTGLIRPVTGLVAGPDGTGGVVLSYVDERNNPSEIAGYEISRGDDVLDTVEQSTRVSFDREAPVTGTLTYSVVAVGRNGLRSDAQTVTLVVGPTPVPAAQGRDAVFGGTGSPTASSVTEDCPYTATPNITPANGGAVVSCDGQVAAFVPADAVDAPTFGKLIRRSVDTAEGYTGIGDLYQLVAVIDGSFATLDSFDGYTEVSFRDLRSELSAGVPELVTALRVNDDLAQEQSPRLGAETVAVQVLTVGSFRTVQASGRTIRVFGPDPAIASDRFATAVGLSQTQHRRAASAVIARADDYPDALASAPLAAMVGGPVLLSRTTDVPLTTVLELRRLGVTGVTIVGGTAAISADAEGQLIDLGFEVQRIGGANRFETSAMIARQVGSVDGAAFLATGQNFADALAASAPAASIGRPVLLTPGGLLIDVTRAVARELGITEVHIVGGTAAISEDVAAAVAAAGPSVVRSSGRTRYETAVDLAQDLLVDDLLDDGRPLLASGDGDGVTSPDALAAGPVAGRLGTPLVLTPKSVLPDEVEAFLAGAGGIRGLIMAGGTAAITDDVRAAVDATG